MSEILGTVPPADIELERAFLAAAIQGDDAARVACSVCARDDFYGQFHRDLYAAVRRHLREHGTAPDVPQLVSVLNADHPEVRRLIGEMFGMPSDVAKIHEYGKAVKRAARLREALAACASFVDGIAAGDWRGGDMVRSLQQRVDAAAVDVGGGDDIEDSVELYSSDLRRRVEKAAGGQAPGIPSGFPSLDAATCGWYPGLWCIGGWSSAGKTAVLCSFLLAAAAAGKRSLTYSLDMPMNALRDRLISMRGRFRDGQVKSGALTPDEHAEVERLSVGLYADGVLLTEGQGTHESIRAHATRHRAEYDMIAIDTLQAVAANTRGEREYDRVNDAVEGIKNIAKALDVPVLLTCQAKDPPDRRECASRQIARPQLNDLEGSRRITQLAAGIVLVYRAAYGQPGSADTSGSLILAKHQTGRTTTQPVRWDPDRGVFTPRSDGQEFGGDDGGEDGEASAPGSSHE